VAARFFEFCGRKLFSKPNANIGEQYLFFYFLIEGKISKRQEVQSSKLQLQKERHLTSHFSFLPSFLCLFIPSFLPSFPPFLPLFLLAVLRFEFRASS
jgi:hypothetical protein